MCTRCRDEWKKCYPEISRKSFLLFHDNYTDFVLTLWCDQPAVYAVWAALCAVYSLAMCACSVYITGYGPKILIWLTYWNHFCLTARFCLTAFNACAFVHHYRRYYSAPRLEFRTSDFKSSDQVLPKAVATQWLLQNFSNTVTFLVTLLFWSIIYTGRTQDLASINAHGINALLVLIDLSISRSPVRMLHFHMPCAFLGVYVTFTLLYWASGGTDHMDRAYIYSVLDYSHKPATAAVVVCCVALIAVPLMQATLYAIVRMKTKLYAVCVALSQNDEPV